MGFIPTQLVLGKALLTTDKLKLSSCHRKRANSFYPLVFMYLHIYLLCLHVTLWTMSFLQIGVSDNLLGAVFFIYLEIMCLLLCNSDTSLWCKVFAKICVVTQLVQGSCLKYYVVQMNAGETSIKLTVAVSINTEYFKTLVLLIYKSGYNKFSKWKGRSRYALAYGY